MRRMKEVAPVVLVAAAIAAGCGSDGESDANQERVANDNLVTNPEAAKFCEQPAYGRNEYMSQIGPDLVADIGAVAGNGTTRVLKGEGSDLARPVAREIAPNDAALATIYEIMNAESGITPGKVAALATERMKQMENNAETRSQTCEGVVSRVLETPIRRKYQSGTGQIAVYRPDYDGPQLRGVDSKVSNNTSTIDVFTINAIKEDNDNAARDENISVNWGITAEGQVIQTAHKEGEAKDKQKKDKGGAKRNEKDRNNQGEAEVQAQNGGGTSDNQGETQGRRNGKSDGCNGTCGHKPTKGGGQKQGGVDKGGPVTKKTPVVVKQPPVTEEPPVVKQPPAETPPPTTTTPQQPPKGTAPLPPPRSDECPDC